MGPPDVDAAQRRIRFLKRQTSLEEFVNQLIIRNLLSVYTIYSVSTEERSDKFRSEVAVNASGSKCQILVSIRSTTSTAVYEAAECSAVKDCVRQTRIAVCYHYILTFRSLLVQWLQ